MNDGVHRSSRHPSLTRSNAEAGPSRPQGRPASVVIDLTAGSDDSDLSAEVPELDSDDLVSRDWGLRHASSVRSGGAHGGAGAGARRETQGERPWEEAVKRKTIAGDKAGGSRRMKDRERDGQERDGSQRSAPPGDVLEGSMARGRTTIDAVSTYRVPRPLGQKQSITSISSRSDLSLSNESSRPEGANRVSSLSPHKQDITASLDRHRKSSSRLTASQAANPFKLSHPPDLRAIPPVKSNHFTSDTQHCTSRESAGNQTSPIALSSNGSSVEAAPLPARTQMKRTNSNGGAFGAHAKRAKTSNPQSQSGGLVRTPSKDLGGISQGSPARVQLPTRSQLVETSPVKVAQAIQSAATKGFPNRTSPVKTLSVEHYASMASTSQAAAPTNTRITNPQMSQNRLSTSTATASSAASPLRRPESQSPSKPLVNEPERAPQRAPLTQPSPSNPFYQSSSRPHLPQSIKPVVPSSKQAEASSKQPTKNPTTVYSNGDHNTTGPFKSRQVEKPATSPARPHTPVHTSSRTPNRTPSTQQKLTSSDQVESQLLAPLLPSSSPSVIVVAKPASATTTATVGGKRILSAKRKEDEIAYRPKSRNDDNGHQDQPKRSRSARHTHEPGKYAIPSMDAPYWPTQKAYDGPEVKRKASANGKEKAKTGESSTSDMKTTAALTVAKRDEGRTNRSGVDKGSAAVKALQLSPLGVLGVSGVKENTTRTRHETSRESVDRKSTSRQIFKTSSSSTLRRGSPIKSESSGLTSITSQETPKTFKPSLPLTPSSVPRPKSVVASHDSQVEEQNESAEIEEGPIDMLLEFEDFNFQALSPVQSQHAISVDVNGTPTKIGVLRLLATPRQNLPASPSTPSRIAASQSGTPSKNVTIGRVSVTLSPGVRKVFTSPMPSRSPRMAEPDTGSAVTTRTSALVADILEKAEDEEDVIDHVDQATAARKRRLQMLLEDDPDEEEIPDIQATIPMAPVRISEPREALAPPSRDFRRSSRTASAGGVPERRIEPREPSRSTGLPDGFAKLLRQNKRDSKRGLGAGEAERILASLDRESPRTREGAGDTSDLSELSGEEDDDPALTAFNPYPTPESRQDSKLDDNEKPKTINFDLLLESNTELDPDLLLLAKQAQDQKNRLPSGSLELNWEGFWDRQHAQTNADVKAEPIQLNLRSSDPVCLTLLDAAKRGLDAVVPLLAAGFLDLVSLGGAGVQTITEWLFASALGAEPRTVRAVLVDALLRLIGTASTHPFGNSSRLMGTIYSLWKALGARASLLAVIPETPQIDLAAVDRENASGIICAVVTVAGEMGWLVTRDALGLAQALLALGVDPDTSRVLRQSIDGTLTALWPLCLAEKPAIGLAQALLHYMEHFPCHVRTQVLLAVGQRTEEAREVSRWLAIGLLVPNCLQKLNQDRVHVLPSISLILAGVELIRRRLKDHSPDYAGIQDMVTYLYEVLSDVNGLVEMMPASGDVTGTERQFQDGHGNVGDEHEIREIRSLVSRTAQRLRMPSDDELKLLAADIKSRLSHLGYILQMQVDTALKRKTRMRRTKGGTVQVGFDGQTKLSFGREATASTYNGQ